MSNSTIVCCKTIAILLITVSFAWADGQQRTIRVTGEGKVTAVPDMATIKVGVVTLAPLRLKR
jgi:uncharacterized protein YggE